MAEKKFFLQPDQIERLIDDEGACLATDRIVVDGAPVGYMYREPAGAEVDSGWRILAGDETPEYMASQDNVGVYSLNSLANHDHSIIPLLHMPVGSAFAREEPGGPLLTIATDDSAESPHEGLHPDYPVVDGEYRLTQEWMLTLPVAMNRRIEDGSMVMWRPGLTLHIVAWDNTTDAAVAERVIQLKESISTFATDVVESHDEGVYRATWSLTAEAGETDEPSLNSFLVCETAQLLVSAHYEDEASRSHATLVIESLARFAEPG